MTYTVQTMWILFYLTLHKLQYHDTNERLRSNSSPSKETGIFIISKNHIASISADICRSLIPCFTNELRSHPQANLS